MLFSQFRILLKNEGRKDSVFSGAEILSCSRSALARGAG